MQPVFVGDVQGCADELDDVVRRADQSFGSEWELWLVGDLINRGPANLRVLDCVRERVEAGRARVVLGNHDLALVRTLHGLRAPGLHDTLGELLERPDADEWAEWLRRRPLVETGALGQRRFAMVHASVHPEWTLSELERRARAAEALLGHDDLAHALALLARSDALGEPRDALDRITRCRSASESGRWSAEPPASERAETPEGADGELVPWHALWGRFGHDYGVVYGHWSLQGLHVSRGLRGLDTGCVHHGRDHDGFLTAWVPDLAREDPFATPDSGFWQVPAQRRYYPDF